MIIIYACASRKNKIAGEMLHLLLELIIIDHSACTLLIKCQIY